MRRVQATHRRCSSAFETCQLEPFAYPGKAQNLPEHKAGRLLAHLRIPVSKRPANGDAKAHSSHPERSRCISSWTFRMSSRYTPISCRRTFDCTGGGSARFRVFRSSKVLERRQRILAGKYILAACLIRLYLRNNPSKVLYFGWPETLRRRDTSGTNESSTFKNRNASCTVLMGAPLRSS